MNLLLSRLDEQQRRWYLAVESERLGYGADRILFEITGVDEKTIRRGREELAASLVDRPVDRVRLPGAGRPPTKNSHGASATTRRMKLHRSPAKALRGASFTAKRLEHRRRRSEAGRARNGG